MGDPTAVCASDDCDEPFPLTRPNRQYCSETCRRREKYRRRFERNPDYYRDKANRANARNPEKNRQRVAQWRAENPDGYSKWREANPDYHREWRQQPGPAARHRERERLRRAVKLDTQVEPIREADIYDRDRWVCQLCGGEVDRRSKWPDPLSPSLDHVVPLSAGGTHTKENCQLAHLRCNVAKRDRALADGEQLRLIG